MNAGPTPPRGEGPAAARAHRGAAASRGAGGEAARPSRVVLLGPQRLKPTVIAATRPLAPEGPIATVTAGWQEREGEDAELDQHLDGRTVNLALYRRAEEVFRRDGDLARAHRARQERLRQMQELYAIRLGAAMEACYQLLKRRGDPALLERERQSALETVRALDSEHLARVAEVHAEFEARLRPAERESVARERRIVAGILSESALLAVAGGHVAVLLNRLRLFGVGAAVAGKPVVAWSAGAMALSEKVVLFHDNPPQGVGHAHFLEVGLDLYPDVTPLPHARRRLRLSEADRVSLLAGRLLPGWGAPLDEGARLDWDDRGWTSPAGAPRLDVSGRVLEVAR